MIQENFNQNTKANEVIRYSRKPANLQEIIKAIIHGKYSWACVLFLRFYGYEPLEYIPYKIYKKLVEENSLSNNHQQNYHHDKSVNNSVVRIY